MNERTLEWMAVCGESIGHKIGRSLAIAATVICLLWTFLTFQIVFMIATVLFGVLSYWLNTHSYIEYEYSFFSDELEIAAIYNKARRKQKMTCKLSEVEYAVKGIDKKENVKYFCNQKNVDDIYTLVLNQEGKRTSVVVEQQPEFIQILKMKQKLH